MAKPTQKASVTPPRIIVDVVNAKREVTRSFDFLPGLRERRQR